MAEWFSEMPGRWYLLAILLPFIAFALQLITGTIRFALRTHRDASGFRARYRPTNSKPKGR